MNLQKLNPWNWFKHEEDSQNIAIHHPSSLTSTNPSPEYKTSNHPVHRLHKEFDRLFDDLFNSFSLPGVTNSSLKQIDDLFRPNIDVSGSDGAHEISLDVPGLDANDLTIDVHGETLIIKGEVHQEEENKDKHYYRMERRYGAFQRTLALPEDAISDDITANLNQGVLRVSIPRQEQPEVQPQKRITINTSH